MTAVVRLSDHRRKPPYLHFTRAELNLLLGLYASRVRTGEWRDYAIHLGPEAACFMVFRHAHEHPLYVISKVAMSRARGKNRAAPYVVATRQHKLGQGQTLADVLSLLNRQIKLVSG